jgi:hypothetical protein
VSAYFAAGRGKVRDDSDDDVKDSEVTVDTSDQESTAQDDQSRPRRAARDVSNLTTYRRDRNSFSSEETKSLSANVLSGGYKFNVGSSVNVFRKIHGHGRRVPRRPLRSIQGTAQHRVLTRPSNNGRTTLAVNSAE